MAALTSQERVAKPTPTEAPVTDPLTRLVELVAGDFEVVNRLIVERMASPVPLVADLARYIVASGGKRFRPLLTLAAARLCGYQGQRHAALAACVEFIHTATLLHDDVVDGSDQRRGLASANAVFGNQASVLVGDFLFSRAFQLMVEDGSLEVLRILSNASAVIAEGEVLQLSTVNNLDTTEDQYREVIGAKTAALFAAACEIGPVVADRGRDEAAALSRFGTALGMAFQVVDDVLDYGASEARFGKGVGDDFHEGKLTYPLIHAVSRADADERRFWQRTVADLDQEEADLDRARAIMTRHGSFRAAIALAEDYAAQAHRELAAFPPGVFRTALADVVDFSVSRGY